MDSDDDDMAPVDPVPEDATLMEQLGRALDKAFGNTPDAKRVGFCLWVFLFDGPMPLVGNYVSNAERGDIIKMVRKWLRHQERLLRAEEKAKKRGH